MLAGKVTIPVVTGRSYMFTADVISAASFRTHCLETPAWYALYTCARHEKRVAEQLAERRVEFFLPLYRSVRRWNDRSRLVELPLLPGYLFLHIALRDRLLALQIPGVVRLLSFGALPVALPDDEVRQLRDALRVTLQMEPHPYLRSGARVRVVHGPLAGTEGYVVRSKNMFRIVISLHLLLRSIAVELDAADVELIPHSCTPRPTVGVLAMSPAEC